MNDYVIYLTGGKTMFDNLDNLFDLDNDGSLDTLEDALEYEFLFGDELDCNFDDNDDFDDMDAFEDDDDFLDNDFDF